jgi:hypothetical protein
MVPIAVVTLHFVIRISSTDGVVASSYPCRLPRKTYLLLSTEVQPLEVRYGFSSALLFHLDERRCVRLLFCGLTKSEIIRLKDELTSALVSALG